MVQLFRNYLKLRMSSCTVVAGSVVSVVIILGLLSTEVGGDSSASYGDNSNLNGDSSLCRVIRNSKKSLLMSFNEKYAATDSRCDLSNHCSNVSCTADFSRGKVDAGLLLELCKDDPTLQFWVDLPGQWEQKWIQTFSAKDFNGTANRAEIIGNQNDKTNQTKKPTKWFIKVLFSITSGRPPVNPSAKYLSIQSFLQICQNEEEGSCTNTTLLNFPRLPQVQVCDFSETSDNDGSFASSSRSSRDANANAFDPHEFSRQAKEKALKFQDGRPLPATQGDKCSSEDIFACGPGATCVSSPSPDGLGTCQCLTGYTINETSKICVKKPAIPSTDDPSSSDSLNSRSYSSALGAIISILLLVAVAAGIFFGTKYHVFARYRHRIPVLRCWPFRRSQPWEDNVTMVNPLGPPDDDDDPPLL